MSTEQQIYDALQTLNDQLATHRRAYEEWASQNKKQVGTAEYRAYVTRFQQWEENVKKQKQALMEQLPAAKTNKQLKEALVECKPMEFLMGMMMMGMRDNTFLKAMLTAQKQVQTENDMKKSIMASVQQGGGGMHGPAPRPAAAPAALPVFNPAVPPPIFRSTPIATIGTNALQYGYSGRADLAAPTKLPSDWTSDPGVKRAFRAPSPVKEYGAGALPFRDFSQT